ncbi:SDR family NAD(P)-dependent oxidoreductase [Novosphingobium lentum]|uniref:SDR family NAD(P)-dependent oxidoreductase n=1 Tax=Novosphingobium lentum TaxID=145287 RepID=UPI000A06337A|nr:SDR family NAD(P)-dependent oxidoreductase [Novosphingobium lentum]
MGEMRFDNQVVIVTGAGRGIGRGHALLLAARGASVVVNDAGGLPDGTGNSSSPAQDVVAEITALGGKAIAITDSVASEAGASHIVAAAIDHFGKIDAVINNAGIYLGQAIDAFDIDTFRRHLEVHVLGAALVLRAAWPHLAITKGRIVNTMSASIFGMTPYSAYISAKGGVLGLTRALAVEGRPAGIKVNCIAPAAATRMMFAAMPDLSEDATAHYKRLLPPEAIAPVAAYLAHADCAVSGECLAVGGGRVTRYIIGETPGITRPELTPEIIRDELSAIMDTQGYQLWPDTESLERATT